MGDTVSTIATLVNEITTYEVITNAVKTSPAPAVTGTTLSLTVDATQLIPTNTYQITVFLTIAAGLKVMVVMIPLTCSDITRDT